MSGVQHQQSLCEPFPLLRITFFTLNSISKSISTINRKHLNFQMGLILYTVDIIIPNNVRSATK